MRKSLSMAAVVGIFVTIYIILVVGYVVLVAVGAQGVSRNKTGTENYSATYTATIKKINDLEKNRDYAAEISLLNGTVTDSSLSDLEKADLYRILATLYFDQKDYQKTISISQDSLKYNPNDDQVLTTLGAAYANLQQNDLALDATDKAIALNPKNHVAYHNKSLILYVMGRKQEALTAVQKAVELAPNNTEYQESMRTIQNSP